MGADEDGSRLGISGFSPAAEDMKGIHNWRPMTPETE